MVAFQLIDQLVKAMNNLVKIVHYIYIYHHKIVHCFNNNCHKIMPNTFDNPIPIENVLSHDLPTMVMFFHITQYKSYRTPPLGKQHHGYACQ